MIASTMDIHFVASMSVALSLGSADLDGLAGGTVVTAADIGDEGFNA